MNRINRPVTGTEDASTADRVFEQAREGASEAIESGAECVRENPFPAVMTALAGGLVIGLLIGWGAAEARHHQYRDAMRETVRWWRDRLHLD